ncbi:MAG TPA: hypothetical protein VGO78_08590, partial [Acidimicrobiales bacterium]|nr:hypothetical protein [Acidimicrobiales bacterium]
HANRLVGCRLGAVRYFDIDYERDVRAAGHEGPRRIESNGEWRRPFWRYDGLDSVDFAVEISTTDDRTFTVTWEPLGFQEGIGIREVAALGYACAEDSPVAVWDVTRRGRWHPYLRRDITRVTLHYLPWDEPEAAWCPRISLGIGTSTIELLLADADPSGALRPSADNVAVLFPPTPLPDWWAGTSEGAAPT